MQPGRKLAKALYFWPGLPQLWKRGSWVGLAVAVGFTCLVNLLVITSLVYRQWFSSEWQVAGLAVGVCLALWAWWQNRKDRRREALAAALSRSPDEAPLPDPVVAQQLDNREQWYSKAQHAYLQGDWVATEQLLLKLLKQDPGDSAARLMLATLWRKQGRRNEAARQLDKLARQDNAEPWQFEIGVERQQMTAEQTEPETEPAALKIEDAAQADVRPANEPGPIENQEEKNKANDQTDQRHAA